jgi:capsid portal protein
MWNAVFLAAVIFLLLLRRRKNVKRKGNEVCVSFRQCSDAVPPLLCGSSPPHTPAQADTHRSTAKYCAVQKKKLHENMNKLKKDYTIL